MLEIGEPVAESADRHRCRSGRRVRSANRLPAGRAARVHARRHRRRRRLRRSELRERSTPGSTPRSSIKRCSKRRCSAGKKSSTKCCAMVPTTASSSATWRTSIRSACTPATRSWSRRRRRSPTSNIRCCAAHRSTSSARSTCKAAATFSSRCIRPQRIRDHRSQSARLAQLGARLESDRLSDRQDLDAHRAWPNARRDSQPRHRRHESGLRTDARLLRREDSALAVRQVSARRHAARHADEIDRRSDGHRPYVPRRADESGTRARPQT